MNIALVGYGKMGRIIEQTAISRGHHIVLTIDLDNRQDLNPERIAAADVAIEFTGPHSAYENLRSLLNMDVPTVTGSTGWLERLPEIESLCRERHGSFLFASNFSVGVNIFFEVNKRLAQLMAARPEYAVQITEIHHTQKKDAPSGTAITLAEQVIEAQPAKKQWVNHPSDKPGELPIISERTDPYPGLHRVIYRCSIDEIEITHQAHNREGFALGAVLAAEYIHDKKGIFSMKEVLGL
jgi:4-hydroxy-tetrahydrodipicolinate reductase